MKENGSKGRKKAKEPSSFHLVILTSVSSKMVLPSQEYITSVQVHLGQIPNFEKMELALIIRGLYS